MVGLVNDGGRKMSVTSDRVRHDFKKSDDIRDAGLKTPDDVERFDDIVYGDDPRWQVLDVYRPKDAGEKELPVIVSVHGGGWVYGDKERYQYYCMSLVKYGFAVVNFTYRLAPEYKFPAALEDINLVINWIMENGSKYHFDTRYIFGVGDSAGAHQLALYSAICTNSEYAEGFDFKVKDGFVPTAVALNCGAYTIDPENGDELTSELMKDYLPDGGTKEELYTIDVTNHITEKFPPVFYMTCTGDFLEYQAFILSKKLVEKSIPSEFHFYGDSEKELGHVFHCNMKLDEAERCNREECEYFKKFV